MIYDMVNTSFSRDVLFIASSGMALVEFVFIVENTLLQNIFMFTWF